VNILYIASGIPVPGSLGGSTHTLEVARGLAARGHTLHVVACSSERRLSPQTLLRPDSTHYAGFYLHHIDIPKAASLLALPVIERLARAIAPDIIMERYYNFAGCGVIAAQRLHVPCLLEVNALIVDPPSVQKRRIDDALGGPMRRWAERQCHLADRIITPLHTTVPASIPRQKIVELPWGAAIERFREETQDPRPKTQEPQNRGTAEPLGQGSEEAGAAEPRTENQEPVIADEQRARAVRNTEYGIRDTSHQPPASHRPPSIVFLGSFRAWHGVTDVIRAGGVLLDQGRDLRFLLVGDGPQREEAERLAKRWPGRFQFTGAVPYEQVPALLREADIGVAPFNTTPHPALRAAGFFWSPLKVYEYMAAGLPVVTVDIPPLNQAIRDGQEGALFQEGDIADLARALGGLLDDPAAAQAMGRRARERVVARYSWARHCAELELVMQELRG
jgi:glycosyltransferase involved in cell wall biosynthesis